MNRYYSFGAIFTLLITALCISACDENPANSGDTTARTTFEASQGSPVLDGSASDDAWDNAAWYQIDQLWAGNKPDSTDFKGRYKVLWDNNMLYILAEITDDTLTDIHSDSFEKYFDDDCLEIMVDEDQSGGDHTYSYNAFAYHIALDGKVVDVAPDSTIRYFDDHCISRKTTIDNISVWEIGVKVFDGNSYQDTGERIPKSLSQGKKIGFAIGYSDNDHSTEREHYMGNVPLKSDNKPITISNASEFGTLELK